MQLHQIGLALHNYHDVHSRFPADFNLDDKPLLSWRIALLPYLEHGDYGDLYGEFKLDEPWDSEHNQRLLDRLPPIYRDVRVADSTRTTFQVFAGEGAGFHGKDFGFRSILDGSSNTLAVVQSPPERSVPWTKPEDLPFVANDLTRVLGKLPSDGILALMFDGEVLHIPSNTSKEIWARLIDPDDGEIIDLPRR